MLMNIKEVLEVVLEGKSVLVVDDEPKIQNLVMKYLERASVDKNKIVFAYDGVDALRKVQNQEFGLIIVDIVMPKKNGLQVFKELRDTAKMSKTPVLIMSGNLHPEIVKQAIILGAKHILSKPFNYDLFIERVFRAIGNVA